MRHLMLQLVLRIEELQLGHQLTAITDTEAQRVGASVEAVQRSLRLLIEEDTCCPALSRPEDVRVREATAEDDELYIIERLTTRDEVGQMHVLDVEACEIEGISHFTLTIRPLVSEDGGTDRRLRRAVGIETEVSELTREALRSREAEGLILIAFVASLSQLFAALILVHQIRGAVPEVALGIDVERERGLLAVADRERTTIGRRRGDASKADAGITQHFFEDFGSRGLHEHTWVLGKEELDDIVLREGREVDRQPALRRGEAHLQQRRDEATARDIVTSRQYTALDEFLHSGEGFAEVFGLLDAGRLITELTQCLCQSRTTESQRRETEVDMIDRVCGIHDEHR